MDSNKIQLKFKGNTIQVEKAISKLNKGDPESAVLADRSEHGWKVVEEYETEELAEDSDDEKKIKSAIKSAAAKKKAIQIPTEKGPILQTGHQKPIRIRLLPLLAIIFIA